jgi:nucleoside triphosphatase
MKYPEVAVGTLIINPEGEVLLIKFSEPEDYYHIPGGHIELGETIEKAAKREIKEETSLDADSVDVLFVQEAIFPKEFHKREDKHFIFIECLCKVHSSKVEPNEEIQVFKWIKPDIALSLNLDPYTRKFIEVYLKDKKE